MPLFTRYIMVDWSAAATPKTGGDSIWLLDYRRGRAPILHNPATRAAAVAMLADWLAKSIEHKLPTLVGWDFPFGYPVNTVSRVCAGAGKPWQRVWQELTTLVKDDTDNRNNRFAVASQLNQRLTNSPAPFWGCPARQANSTLSTHKPRPQPFAEWRHTDACLKKQHPRWNQPVWKIAYTGSCGGQALTGIPAVWRLVNTPPLCDHSLIWPFTSGLQVPHGQLITHCEIYPSIFALPAKRHPVKDAAQLLATASGLRQQDDQGSLPRYFTPSISAANKRASTDEEGWILGVLPPLPEQQRLVKR